MPKKYYVYLYLDPRVTPPEPIYVGKGYGARSHAHLSWTHNPWLRRKIRRIREAGLEPVIKIVRHGLDADEAGEHERMLIREYGRADLNLGTLCNFTDGGEGSTGRVVSEETRALWSKQRCGKPQTARQYAANCARRQTPEARRRASAANKGRKPSAETVEAIRQYNRTRPITDAMREKWSRTRKAMGVSQDHQKKMQEGKRRAIESRSPEEQEKIFKKISEKNRGAKRSEETKRKMREAWQRRRERGSA
jgi:hypothetical protein